MCHLYNAQTRCIFLMCYFCMANRAQCICLLFSTNTDQGKHFTINVLDMKRNKSQLPECINVYAHMQYALSTEMRKKIVCSLAGQVNLQRFLACTTHNCLFNINLRTLNQRYQSTVFRSKSKLDYDNTTYFLGYCRLA